MKIDCVYVISLHPQTDEYKELIMSRLESLGLEQPFSYFILKATNGLAIPDSEPYTLMPNWKLEDKNLEGVDKSITEFWTREISPGEIGCSISHIRCWEDAMEAGHNNILVLESDFQLKDNIDWKSVEDHIWDIVHLGRIKQSWYGEGDRPIPGTTELVKPGYGMNAHAYILNKKAIEKFIELDLRHNLIPVDEFLPATYYHHPREDVRSLFPVSLEAIAWKMNNWPVGQQDNESLTEPRKEDVLRSLIEVPPKEIAHSGPVQHGELPPTVKIDEVEEAEVEDVLFEKNDHTNVAPYIRALREYEFANGFTPKNTFLYDYINYNDADKEEFQKEYFHPDFLMAAQNPAGYGSEWGFIIEEPIPDVLCFPFFKKSLCDAIIDECEHFNHFLDEESGSNSSDNYPTTDVRLESIPGTENKHQAPIDMMYREILNGYIADIITHKWRYSIKGIQQTFVAKYETSGQPGLSLHHDLCTCACLVRLNEDYTGGGTWFESHQTLVDPPLGYATIHPSRLTHRHGGRQVLSGTRYLMVTFID